MVARPEAPPRSAAAQTRLSGALRPRPLAGAAGLGGAPRTLPAPTPTPQQQPPASSPCPPFLVFAGKLTLLLRPCDVDHVKAQRIAHDRIAGRGRLHFGLQHRLPLRRRPCRYSIEVARLFRPAHLITLR